MEIRDKEQALSVTWVNLGLIYPGLAWGRHRRSAWVSPREATWQQAARKQPRGYNVLMYTHKIVTGEAAERGRPGAPAPFGGRPRCPWQPLAPVPERASGRAGRASAPFPLPLGGKSACPRGREKRQSEGVPEPRLRSAAGPAVPGSRWRPVPERASGRAGRASAPFPPSPWRQICLPGGREKRQSEGVPEPRLRSAAGPAVPGSRWRPVPERASGRAGRASAPFPPSPWRQICLPGGREKRQSEGVPEPRLRSAAGPAVPAGRWRPVPERASRQGLRALPPFPLAANLPARWPGEAAERGRPGAPAPFGRRPRCPCRPLAPGAGAGEQAGPPRPSPLPLGGKSACPVAGRSGRARASRSPGSVRPPAPLSLPAAGARCRNPLQAEAPGSAPPPDARLAAPPRPSGAARGRAP
ncbi:collagen alpha-1(I) chain-like [Penaeus chinensis]|uniref:collagen alpha-1(I) chain-like n=1 Tax=Penaeus chinensis TaxID=139456 RepID=UPI001FB6D4B9|nr:collagen alpha-1(I) chain-like [Penaeus chinensis]